LEYLGQVGRPLTGGDIRANRFTIVLRDMPAAELAAVAGGLAAVARDGVPNYFDDQRFGSLSPSGEFIALPWCRGDYERALWLAIAEPNPHDRPDDREAKETLRRLWGDWTECKAALPRSSTRSIVTYLVDHPTDFRRALALVRQDLRSLYLAAFQSHLWNRVLAAWLRQALPAERLFPVGLAAGDVPFFGPLTDAERSTLARWKLPLPSARLHLEPGPVKDLVDSALAADGVALRELRVKYPRDSFFSRADRPAIALPAELRHQPADDDLYPGRQKLTVAFDLPRGAYATIVVKRIDRAVA
jgi:tRNA pseudouridine13 synthase